MGEDRWAKGFLIGLALGAAAGAVAALLLAPESGEKTRQRIKEKAEDAFAAGKRLVRRGEESESSST